MILQELLTYVERHWEAVAILFFRIGALISVSPGLGTAMVSQRTKLILALALSNVMVFALPAGEAVISAQLILSEISIGLLLGFGLRFLFWALQIAGTIAAQATSLSQLLGGASVEPMPAIGQILSMGGLALFFVLDLHIIWVSGVFLLYETLPIGLVVSGLDVFSWGTSQLKHTFDLAFQLSAPFLILAILYNVTLGIVNKAMPQLMVAFVGAPVITFCGLVFLLFSAGSILSVWAEVLEGYLMNPLELR